MVHDLPSGVFRLDERTNHSIFSEQYCGLMTPESMVRETLTCGGAQNFEALPPSPRTAKNSQNPHQSHRAMRGNGAMGQWGHGGDVLAWTNYDDGVSSYSYHNKRTADCRNRRSKAEIGLFSLQARNLAYPSEVPSGFLFWACSTISVFAQSHARESLLSDYVIAGDPVKVPKSEASGAYTFIWHTISCKS